MKQLAEQDMKSIPTVHTHGVSCTNFNSYLIHPGILSLARVCTGLWGVTVTLFIAFYNSNLRVNLMFVNYSPAINSLQDASAHVDIMLYFDMDAYDSSGRYKEQALALLGKEWKGEVLQHMLLHIAAAFLLPAQW